MAAVQFTGLVQFFQALLLAMTAGGSIIQISSVTAKIMFDHAAAYMGTKQGSIMSSAASRMSSAIRASAPIGSRQMVWPIPQREIASAVNLSAAAVQRRIAAMEKSGFIAGNVAIAAPEVLSLGITAIVEVNLHDERSASVDAAKALFREVPEVQQCSFAIGEISFVLVIVTCDMRA